MRRMRKWHGALPGDTPAFPQSRPRASRLRLGVSPAGSRDLSSNQLCGAGEEALGQDWGRLDGYGSGIEITY